jgi:hypothetical protein
MFLALSVVVGTIAVGLGLASLPGLGARALGAVRSFALAAAVTVVLLHLLPDAIEALGVRAALAMALGLVLPMAVERGLAKQAARDGVRLAFEVGFAGLLAHQVGDGLALWALARDDAHLGGLLAVGAHIVPVTTVMVLPDVEAGDVRRAWLRAAGLGAATVAGLGLGAVVPEGASAGVFPWITAVASGLLLHVVAHEVAGPPPSGAIERTFDLGAAVIGVGISVGSAILHGDAHASTFVRGFAMELWTQARATALPMLAGATGLLLVPPAERRAMLERAGAWISAGLVIAAFGAVVLPPGEVGAITRVLALGLMVLLGTGTALAAAPLAVVLSAHLSAPWIYGALVLGPLMTARSSRPGAAKLGVWIEIGAALLAMAGARGLDTPLAEVTASRVAAGLVAAALAAGVWRAGVRGWIARLGVHGHE